MAQTNSVLFYLVGGHRLECKLGLGAIHEVKAWLNEAGVTGWIHLQGEGENGELWLRYEWVVSVVFPKDAA